MADTVVDAIPTIAIADANKITMTVDTKAPTPTTVGAMTATTIAGVMTTVAQAPTPVARQVMIAETLQIVSSLMNALLTFANNCN